MSNSKSLHGKKPPKVVDDIDWYLLEFDERTHETNVLQWVQQGAMQLKITYKELGLIFETYKYPELEQPTRPIQPTILNDYLIDDFVKDKNDAAQMRAYHVQKGKAKYNHDLDIADYSRKCSAYDKKVAAMRDNQLPMYNTMFQHLSGNSKSRVAKEDGWAQCRDENDPLKLWMLIKITHIDKVVGDKVSNGVKAKKAFWSCNQRTDERVDEYMRRLQDLVDSIRHTGATAVQMPTTDEIV